MLTFSSCLAEPMIKFSEVKYNIQEPQRPGEIAVLKISVLRLGDTSKVSIVRIHTKDGSAASGEDYNPMSEGKILILNWTLQQMLLHKIFKKSEIRYVFNATKCECKTLTDEYSYFTDMTHFS